MQHFVTYCDSHQRLQFLKRLAAATGWHGTVLTCKPSLFAAARYVGFDGHIVRHPGNGRHELPAGFDTAITATLECRIGEITLARARKFVAALRVALAALPRTVDLVFSWNGGVLADVALGELAQARALPQLFFEIGNLPGCVFADPHGTSGDALVAQAPEYMADVPVQTGCFDAWRNQFMTNRLAQCAIPQQRAPRIERILAPFDVSVSRIVRSARPQRLSARRIGRRLRPARISQTAVDNAPPDNFFLHCMQVSDDTNMLLRSNLSVLQALQRATEQARAARVPLGVCLHPAERSHTTFEQILEWIQLNGDVFLLGGNSFHWVLRAQRVIVVNSTIGLEAKLAGRPVTTLGRCLYAQWSDDDIRNYVQRWLLPIDYFNTASTGASSVDAAGLSARLDYLIGIARRHPRVSSAPGPARQ